MGNTEMNEKSTEWVFVPQRLGPPPPLVFIDKDRNRRAVIHRRGFVSISTDRCCSSSYGDDIIVRDDDLRGLIASLQSILVLAEEHFGEDWGK